jgi:hypothetical protein
VTRYRTKFANYVKWQFRKWQPTLEVNDDVIVKCANKAFTKVQKDVNDFNCKEYPKYARAYNS